MRLRSGLGAVAAVLLIAAVAGGAAGADDMAGADAATAALAQEARQTIAAINWFYVRNRACPQPSRPAEMAAFQRDLGDGFSLDRDGSFVAIRGISMSDVWFYYASPAHPDRCTLWRRVGDEPILVWRRHSGGGRWAFTPSGGGEREIYLNP